MSEVLLYESYPLLRNNRNFAQYSGRNLQGGRFTLSKISVDMSFLRRVFCFRRPISTTPWEPAVGLCPSAYFHIPGRFRSTQKPQPSWVFCARSDAPYGWTSTPRRACPVGSLGAVTPSGVAVLVVYGLTEPATLAGRAMPSA